MDSNNNDIVDSAIDSSVYLREAAHSDIDILYEWANDSLTRQNSFNSELIPYEAHKKWFTRMMQDSSYHQFILMRNEQPIGKIRLNINGSNAEIGYSIAKSYRNLGYGHKILQLLSAKVKNQLPEIKNLIAKVKPDNLASQKLFESEGYEMKYLCYSLDTQQKTQNIQHNITKNVAEKAVINDAVETVNKVGGGGVD